MMIVMGRYEGLEASGDEDSSAQASAGDAAAELLQFEAQCLPFAACGDLCGVGAVMSSAETLCASGVTVGGSSSSGAGEGHKVAFI